MEKIKKICKKCKFYDKFASEKYNKIVCKHQETSRVVDLLNKSIEERIGFKRDAYDVIIKDEGVPTECKFILEMLVFGQNKKDE